MYERCMKYKYPVPKITLYLTSKKYKHFTICIILDGFYKRPLARSIEVTYEFYN